MITGINQSKTLKKHILCEWIICKLDGRKCNSDQWWNNDNCRCECKQNHVYEKDYVWNPATCNCENGKYLASIMDDLAITCNEIIESYDEETKNIPTNFNEKNITCKTQNFYVLFIFSLITIALLVAVSIYCYLIKYRAKKKIFITIHVINSELK